MKPLHLSKWLRTTLLLIVLAGLAVPTCNAQAKQQTAIEKLANLLGDALKTATGRNVKRQVPAQRVLAQPAMPVAVTPAVELKERKERLVGYSDAATEWINHFATLKEAQKGILAGMYAEKIADSQVSAKKVDANSDRSHRYFADYFVIKFTDVGGAARALNFTRQTRKLNAVKLTDEQDKLLTRAIDERNAFLESAAIGQLMNVLDAELYFTPDQRQAFAEGVASTVNLDVTGFGFQTSSYYFNQRLVGPILQRGDYLKVLGDAQRLRAADLASTGSSSGRNVLYVSFRSDEGVETWQTKLKGSIQGHRDLLMRAIAVRVDFHCALCDISDDNARYLLVAGKGATDKVIADWKVTARQQLKTYEQHAAQWGGQGNFSFSLASPSVQTLAKDEIWTHALESKIPEANDQLTHRDHVRTQATAEFTVAMLDKELWLTKSQRQHLIKAVVAKLPAPDRTAASHSYYTEITLLALALFKLSDQDISILNDKQKRVWELMKKPFQENGNHITIQRRNGGQMSIMIPE